MAEARHEVESWGRALRGGTLAVGAMLPVCLMVPLLLQQAGMPYPGAYTAMLVVSILGTLYMAYRGRALLVLPSVSLTVWLVWLVMLAGGLNWQFVLAVQAIAAAGGWFIWWLWGRRADKAPSGAPDTASLPLRFWCCAGHRPLLPPVLHWAVPTLLGAMLLLYGLVLGRVLIHSPWALVSLGNLQDPMAYLTLIGLLVLALLWARRVHGAALWAGLVTGLLALAEGFWVLPAAPFLLPEGLDRTALMLNPWLTLPTGGVGTAVLTGLVLVLTLSSLGWSAAEAVEAVEVVDQDGPQAISQVASGAAVSQAIPLVTGEAAGVQGDGAFGNAAVRATFALTFLGAFLGSVPVTIAPASAVTQAEGPAGRRTALVMVLWLLVLLLCAPVVRSMAEFPVAAAPMLVGAGLYLLGRQVRRAQALRWSRVEALTAVTVLALTLSWNVTAALGAGLLVWVLTSSVSGQAAEVSWPQRLLALVWLAYFFGAYL